MCIRDRNPEHPQMRGSHENGDIFFQNREASNKYYEAVQMCIRDRNRTAWRR